MTYIFIPLSALLYLLYLFNIGESLETVQYNLTYYSSEHRLMRNLLRGYEKSVRPVFNSSETVAVAFGLTLTQILDLDEKNQVLTTNVWMEVEWFDEKLKWNSTDYYGLTSIRIPCNHIWLPDIVLYNSVDDYTSGYMPSLAMVYNNSRVFWGPVVRFRSSCKIDITYFPFDDQVCRMKLGSWAYNAYQVEVLNRSTSMDLSNFVDNGEWELIGVRVKSNVVYYNCCVEPFPDVTFYIHLRRRIKYYFMNIIIPCIILSFLCLASFLLPPEGGEKITLGLSVLLTITVFMLMVADKMPQTSESISVISIYLMVVLSMSCLSVLTSVWILSIHHQRGKLKTVPRWVKTLVASIFAPMLCIKLKKDNFEPSQKRQNNKDKKLMKRSRVSMEEPEIIRLEPMDELQEISLIAKNGYKDNFKERQDAINQLINLLQTKHHDEVNEDEVLRDWRDVAFVLDRLLFVVFLFIITASTVCILEMRPND